MALGKNVEHLRNLRAMSRGAVARAIGLDDDQPIYALEKRDSKRSNLAPSLAKLFSVSLESLLEDDLTSLTAAELNSSPRHQVRVQDKADDSARLAAIYEELGDSSRTELVRFAEYLLSKDRA